MLSSSYFFKAFAIHPAPVPQVKRAIVLVLAAGRLNACATGKQSLIFLDPPLVIVTIILLQCACTSVLPFQKEQQEFVTEVGLE